MNEILHVPWCEVRATHPPWGLTSHETRTFRCFILVRTRHAQRVMRLLEASLVV